MITYLVNLQVLPDETDDSEQFLFQINECLDKRNNIPKNLPISFDITKQNRHIEIVAHYENKFDFFKINWDGVYCYRELGEHDKLNGTVEEDNKQCDKYKSFTVGYYTLSCEFFFFLFNNSRPLSTHHDYGVFHCAYDVWTTIYDDEEYVVFSIDQQTDGILGSNAYIINKSTDKVVFYDFEDKFSGGKFLFSLQ